MAFSAEAARVSEWVSKVKTVGAARASKTASRNLGRSKGVVSAARRNRARNVARYEARSARRAEARVGTASRLTGRRRGGAKTVGGKTVHYADKVFSPGSPRGASRTWAGPRPRPAGPPPRVGSNLPVRYEAPRGGVPAVRRTDPNWAIYNGKNKRTVSKKLRYGIAGGAVAVGTGLGIHQTNKSRGVTTSMPNGLTDITTAP